MNAAEREASAVEKAAAITQLLAPVDNARAVFWGQVIVGHRRSVEVGDMCWALPGRGWAYASTLLLNDPAFTVLAAPSAAWLREQRGVLAGLR